MACSSGLGLCALACHVLCRATNVSWLLLLIRPDAESSCLTSDFLTIDGMAPSRMVPDSDIYKTWEGVVSSPWHSSYSGWDCWPWRGPYIRAGIFTRMKLCCKSCTRSNCNWNWINKLNQTLILVAPKWTFFKTVFQFFGIGVTTPQQLIYVLL